jgi:hypothetical protein
MRYPNDQQHISIVGATGSGKTQAGAFHLSRRNYTTKPWLVYDFKGEDLFNEIENAFHLSADDKVPEKPGLYIVHAVPEDPGVDEQMLEIWHRENIGVMIDEGYMIGRQNRPFRYLLTQGRSKHIPLIVLSQRPVWMDRFVFSESSFFQIFRLQHKKDLANVNEFIPFDLSERLPEYHSYYYDVGNNTLEKLSPVPDRQLILDTFDSRLQNLKRVV